MTELERALSELGARIDFPETPDLAARVRAQLSGPERPPRWTRRRLLALVLALLAVAAGAVLAVPPARTAILEWLGISGARIELVDSLPEVPPRGRLALGERVSLEEARERAPYRVLVPALVKPDEVYFREPPPGGEVTLLYGSSEEVRLLFTQFRASSLELIKKAAAPDTRIEPVIVNGGRGFWLEGEPHVVVYRDASGEIREETLRLAGNVLLWERGELTLRLEGRLTKEQALGIARAVR
jgi:hypothetical protein